MIRIIMEKPEFRKGDPYFYLAWRFVIDGRKYFKGAQFPFSLS